MSTKHTPGPWEIKDHSQSDDCQPDKLSIETDCYFIAQVDCCESQQANARLIAAAPELLEALQGLVRAYEALPGAVTHNGSRHSHAVYAIKKALGEEA